MNIENIKILKMKGSIKRPLLSDLNESETIDIYTFSNPSQLEKWVDKNISNPHRQKELIHEGTRYYIMYRTHYEIQVENSAKIHKH